MFWALIDILVVIMFFIVSQGLAIIILCIIEACLERLRIRSLRHKGTTTAQTCGKSSLIPPEKTNSRKIVDITSPSQNAWDALIYRRKRD